MISASVSELRGGVDDGAGDSLATLTGEGDSVLAETGSGAHELIAKVAETTTTGSADLRDQRFIFATLLTISMPPQAAP